MHKKEVLEEFIYRLNEKASFLQKSTFWSSPVQDFPMTIHGPASL